MNVISSNSVLYRELLEWWLEFRNLFLADKEQLCIIWNNKDIRIDEKPVFYESYYDSRVSIIKDLLFNLDNIESFQQPELNYWDTIHFDTEDDLLHRLPKVQSLSTTYSSNQDYMHQNDPVPSNYGMTPGLTIHCFKSKIVVFLLCLHGQFAHHCYVCNYRCSLC